MSDDKLMVQVALSIRAPQGVKITQKVLQQLVQLMVEGKELPPNVEVKGIFWRNPTRAGSTSYWRYHEGADLTNAPTPIESRPRGSLQDAIETLAPFLETGNITF